MTIVDSFWLGGIGFVKVNNGFETKTYVGIAQGQGEKQDTEHIARYGTQVPETVLVQFLDNSQYSRQYITE